MFGSDGLPVDDEQPWDDGDRETWWSRSLDAIPTPKEIGLGMRRLVGLGPDESIARNAFAQAEQLFRERRYSAAARKYRKAAFRWPDSTLEEDSLFMLGESYFFADRYAAADDSFGNLFEKYENSRHLERAVSRQFTVAQYWEQTHAQRPHWAITPNLVDRTRPWFDTLGNARKAYESVHLHDPTGPLADDSLMSLANSYFIRDQFDDADHYYTIVRTDYPKSQFQVDAHLIGLRAKLGRYQGPAYDGVPLEESEELADQILAQFGSQLGDERQRVLRAREEIRGQRALRDYDMAQYYERTGYHRAARFYYGVVVEDFPGTQFADASQARMAALEGLPDETSILDRVQKVTALAGKRLVPGSSAAPKVATEPTENVPLR